MVLGGNPGLTGSAVIRVLPPSRVHPPVDRMPSHAPPAPAQVADGRCARVPQLVAAPEGHPRVLAHGDCCRWLLPRSADRIRGHPCRPSILVRPSRGSRCEGCRPIRFAGPGYDHPEPVASPIRFAGVRGAERRPGLLRMARRRRKRRTRDSHTEGRMWDCSSLPFCCQHTSDVPGLAPYQRDYVAMMDANAIGGNRLQHTSRVPCDAGVPFGGMSSPCAWRSNVCSTTLRRGQVREARR